MAGSPIKRLRKAGVPIPNLGARPPRKAAPNRPRARACALPDLSRPLEPDPELAIIGKTVLRNVAELGDDDRSRVAAARALVEVTRTAEKRNIDLSVALLGLNGEELQRLEVKARQMVEGAS
jgi:hypothetical protein